MILKFAFDFGMNYDVLNFFHENTCTAKLTIYIVSVNILEVEQWKTMSTPFDIWKCSKVNLISQSRAQAGHATWNYVYTFYYTTFDNTWNSGPRLPERIEEEEKRNLFCHLVQNIPIT